MEPNVTPKPIIEFSNVTKLMSHRHDTGRRNHALRLIGLHRFFRPQPLDKTHFAMLNKISFQIQPKEKALFLCTDPEVQEMLIRLMVGVTTPTKGKLVRPRQVRLVTAKMRGQRPLLSLRTHILALSAFLGVRRKQALQVLERVVETLDIRHLVNERVVDIERIDLVRANYFTMLFCPADTYVFDEIFIPELIEEQLNYLADKTVVFVSSKPKFPKELLPQGYLIDEGQIKFQGSAEIVAEKFSKAGEDLHQFASELSSDDDEDDVEFDQSGETPLVRAKAGPRRVTEGVIPAIEITKVVPGHNGAPPPTLLSGADVNFEVHYAVRNPEKAQGAVSASITFRNIREQRIACTWSAYRGQEFHPIPAQGKFTLRVPKFPLTAGNYGMIISLLVDKVTVDKLVVPEAFRVEEGDFYGQGAMEGLPAYGAVWMPFEWELDSGTEKL